MTVLLDTDHISILQRDESPEAGRLRAHLEPLSEADIAVSIVSFQEQSRGWLAYIHRARKREQVLVGFSSLHEMLLFYATRKVLHFDDAAMDEFLALQQQRIRIGTDDLHIAAIAKTNGVKLLSRNLRDFRHVPGLDLEDWTV